MQVDALAWCITTQQALFAANWPTELEQHPATAIRLRPGVAWGDATAEGSGSQAIDMQQAFPCSCEVGTRAAAACTSPAGTCAEPQGMQVDMSQVMFRGLRVRMSLATGVCEDVRTNVTSKSREYTGQARCLATGPA